MEQQTLKVNSLNGKTIGLTVIILLVMVGSLEGLLRVEYLQSYLNRFVPNYGSRHRQLEIQLARLDTFVDNNGQVDCIMFGSSLVWLGFNPPVFEETFLDVTGQNINCFNFGIETLPADAAGTLAQIIVKQYQPTYLIYGTSARDYAPNSESEDTTVILESSWVRYQMGDHSPISWLQNHSYIFKYAKQLQFAIRFDTDGLRNAQEEKGVSVADTSGFLPKTRPAQEVHFAAAEKDAARLFHPYTIYSENLEGLEQIIDLQNSVPHVLIVEMPVSDEYFGYFENGKDDYDRFVAAIVAITADKKIPLIQTSNTQIIPEEGFWDRSHMNLVGANIFTEWLAFQVVNIPMESITE